VKLLEGVEISAERRRVLVVEPTARDNAEELGVQGRSWRR
jgi:hypothetical protein